jgi:hypothetical protein
MTSSTRIVFPWTATTASYWKYTKVGTKKEQEDHIQRDKEVTGSNSRPFLFLPKVLSL